MLQKEINGSQVFLIQTEEEALALIRAISEAPKTNIGLDTETQGLDFLLHKVVGYCVGIKSGVAWKGWYLPFRHSAYPDNLPPYVIPLLLDAIAKHVLILFNRNFDLSMIEHTEGYSFPETTAMHDVQVMCWEAFSVPYPKLKEFYKKYCKKDITSFEDTIEGKDYNFGHTDPRTSFGYAAFDPCATMELGAKIQVIAPYIKKIYHLDNKLTEAIRYFAKQDIYVDKKEVEEFSVRVDRELRQVSKQIFDEVGYPFKLGSDKEKGEALNRVVTLTTKTKTGRYKVSADVLTNIDHPLAKMMIEHSSLETLQGSYIKKLREVESFKVNWNACSAPTGRLSSGGSDKNSYYGSFNISATPKEVEKLYVHPHDKLGLCLKTEPSDLGTSEIKSHLRRCFIAPAGHNWMSSDLSQAELRILCNVSGDKSMADAFNSGRDFHTETAIKVFKSGSKDARDKAKACSFGIVYGSSAYSMAKKFKVSVREAENIIAAYYNEFSQLARWMENQKKLAKRQGIVYTYYGRPRNLRQYYDNSDPKMHAFGDRSSVNTVAQGTCADVLRMKIVQLRSLLETPKFKDNLILAFSVYDELNFYVKEGMEEEMFHEVGKLMYTKPDNWLVPLVGETGIGTSWGTIIDEPTFEQGKIVSSPKIKLLKAA